MHNSLKQILAPVPYEKTRIALLWLVGILAIAFCAWDVVANAQQKTPDWRPINRVYKNDGVTVGNVGSAGQIMAGHVLTAKSFPPSVNSTNTAYWNLDNAVTNGFGISAYDLTAEVSPTFESGIFGDSNGAKTLDVTGSRWLKSTNAFFGFGDVSFTAAAWIKLTNWATGANQMIMGQAYASGDMSWALYIDTANRLTIDFSSVLINPVLASSAISSGWHHLAVRYNSTSKTWTVFFDGLAVASLVSTKTSQTAIFEIGGYRNFVAINGAADAAMFAKGVDLSDQDIRRIYSARIDHNKNLIAKRQDWHFKRQLGGVAGNPYQSLPFLWYDSTDSNSLFIDLSDLGQNDRVDLRLYDLQQ